MALTFDATDDKVTTSFSSHPSTKRTYSIWTYFTAHGGVSRRLFDKRTSGSQVELSYVDTIGSNYYYERALSGGAVNWYFPRGADNTWAHYTIEYDESSPTTDIIVYKDGSLQTVIKALFGTGTVNTNTDAYTIGSRGVDNLRVFNGRLCEFAIWDRALALDEKLALGKGFSPAFFLNGLKLYVPLVREAIDLKNAAPTFSGSPAIADHPRIIYPARHQTRFPGAAAAATVNSNFFAFM